MPVSFFVTKKCSILIPSQTEQDTSTLKIRSLEKAKTYKKSSREHRDAG